MKKMIIISGPKASGKTHIAMGIKMQYDENLVVNTYYDQNIKIDFKNKSLIIIDGVPKEKILRTFNYIRKSNDTINIIITTQDEDVYQKDYRETAHVINCRNLCFYDGSKYSPANK